MPKNEQVAVVDIGSSKLTAFIGERGVNKTFIIKGYNEILYSGYWAEDFLDEEETETKLRQLLLTIKQSKSIVKKVFVGVPANFTKNIVRDAQISFNKKRKITEKEIEELYKVGFGAEFSDYKIINRSPIYYELDDFRKTPDAIGEQSATLKGRVSYVLAKENVLSFLRKILKTEDFSEIEFVSVPLAEALYLISPDERDRLAFVADIGYISTSFSIVQGDGMLFLTHYNFGGGVIAGCIAESFNVSFDIAEKVLKKASLSTETKENDVYEIMSGDDCMYFNMNKVKKIIVENLDKLAEELENSFKKARIEIPEYLPLLITGGGITYIRGAKEHLSNRLNVNVEVIYPDLPLYNKPVNSSVLSVLNLALDNN